MKVISPKILKGNLFLPSCGTHTYIATGAIEQPAAHDCDYQ